MRAQFVAVSLLALLTSACTGLDLVLPVLVKHLPAKNTGRVGLGVRWQASAASRTLDP
jgi:hypothetical protein